MQPLQTPFGGKPLLGPAAEKALRAPIGAASPLWFAYMGAAGAGVAYWWMTRWTRSFAPSATSAPPVPALMAPAPEPLAATAAEPAPVEAVLAEPVPPGPAPVPAVAEAASKKAPPKPPTPKTAGPKATPARASSPKTAASRKASTPRRKPTT